MAEAEDLLLVCLDALASKQDFQPPIAKALPFIGKTPQPLAHLGIDRLEFPVHYFGINLDQLTSPPP